MRILLNALAHYLFVLLIFAVTLIAIFSIILLYPYFFYSSSLFLSLIHFNNLCLKITILFLKFHLRKLKNIGNPFCVLQIELKLNEHGMIQRQIFYENCYILSLFIQHIIDFCAFLITINISYTFLHTNKFCIVLWNLIWFFFFY